MIPVSRVATLASRHVLRRPLDFLSMAFSLGLGMLLLVLILTAVNGFVSRPPAAPNVHERIRIHEGQQAGTGKPEVSQLAPAAWQRWRQEKLDAIADTAVSTGRSVTLATSVARERLDAALVSAHFLPVLGIHPAATRATVR